MNRPAFLPGDLLVDQLRDLLSAQNLLVESVPSLAARASCQPLTAFMTARAGDAVRHRDMMAAMLQRRGAEPGGDVCLAMKGLITGGDAHLDSVETPETRDLMMAAHWVRIAHYGVAGHGFALRLARRLGWREEAAILGSILGEIQSTVQEMELLEGILFQLAPKGDPHP